MLSGVIFGEWEVACIRITIEVIVIACVCVCRAHSIDVWMSVLLWQTVSLSWFNQYDIDIRLSIIYSKAHHQIVYILCAYMIRSFLFILFSVEVMLSNQRINFITLILQAVDIVDKMIFCAGRKRPRENNEKYKFRHFVLLLP